MTWLLDNAPTAAAIFAGGFAPGLALGIFIGWFAHSKPGVPPMD